MNCCRHSSALTSHCLLCLLLQETLTDMQHSLFFFCCFSFLFLFISFLWLCVLHVFCCWLRNTRYSDLPNLSSSSSSMGVNNQQQPDTLYCTRDMCPVKIHWHVKTNYRQYWRVKITITNRDFSRNFTQWTLVLQHPNFSNFTQAFSFNYKALSPYASFRSTLLSS